MMRQVARGVSGRLMAGPDVAAELGPWSIALADAMGDAWTCTAEATRRDAYLLAHGRAFALRLDMGAGGWRWRNVEVRVGDGRVLVVNGTGSPEESR